MGPMRRMVVATSLIAALAGCASEAAVRGGVVVRVAGPPPPVRYEVVSPRPGPGHVWVAGHWSVRGSRYVWVGGRWTRPPRRGAVWVAPRYERRHGSWVVVGGYWR